MIQYSIVAEYKAGSCFLKKDLHYKGNTGTDGRLPVFNKFPFQIFNMKFYNLQELDPLISI